MGGEERESGSFREREREGGGAGGGGDERYLRRRREVVGGRLQYGVDFRLGFIWNAFELNFSGLRV